MFPSYAIDKIARTKGMVLHEKLRAHIMKDAMFRSLAGKIDLVEGERWCGSVEDIVHLIERVEYFIGDCEVCGGRTKRQVVEFEGTEALTCVVCGHMGRW